MELITKNNKQVLVASPGHVIQSVSNGLVIGRRLIFGKKDDIKHYHEIPIEVRPDLESENTPE
mgnify:CR=1 FL=1